MGRRAQATPGSATSWSRSPTAIAHGAAKTKETSLAAQYRRIAAKRGKKRVLIAVAHSILVMIYHSLTKRKPYRELGGTYFDVRDQERVQRRLVHRLEALGYSVTLTAYQLTP